MENTSEKFESDKNSEKIDQNLQGPALSEGALNEEDVSDAKVAEDEFFNVLRLDKELIEKFKNPFRLKSFKSWRESLKGLIQNAVVDINSLNIILRRLIDDQVFLIIYEEGLTKHQEIVTLLSTLHEPFQLISTRILCANECTKEFYECELRSITDPPFVIFQENIYKNIHELEELLYCRTIPRAIVSDPAQMKENEYDLVVIGRLLGAMSACQEAWKYSKRVLFVAPFFDEMTSVPCVIRIMKSAVKMFETIRLGHRYGFCYTDNVQLSWNDIVSIALKNSNKPFLNKKTVLNDFDDVTGRSKFTQDGLLNITLGDKTCRVVKGQYYLIVTGSAPRIPNDIIGLKDHALHVEKMFFKKVSPEKTLIIGDSSLCIELAGILNACDLTVTIVIGSGIHDCQNYEESFVTDIRKCMEIRGVNFIDDCQILRITSTKENKKLVEGLFGDGEPFLEEFDTVAYDFGQVPRTSYLGLTNMKVKLSKSRHIIVDENDRSSNPNVFAIGAVAEGKPNSDSILKKAGKYLIERLFNYGTKRINYGSIPKIILGPREYGCVGLTETLAEQLYEESQNKQKIFVFETAETSTDLHFKLFPHTEVRVKMLCTSNETEEITILGLHLVGEKIGDLLQGLSMLVGTSYLVIRFHRILSCSLGPNFFLHLVRVRTIPSSSKDIPEANLEKLDKLIRIINTGKVGSGKAEVEFSPKSYHEEQLKVEEYETESEDSDEEHITESDSLSSVDSKDDIMEKYNLLVSPLFEPVSGDETPGESETA